MTAETFVALQDDGPDLIFQGILLAEVNNRPADSELNTHTSKWIELSLYRTAGGQFVCERGHCSAQPEPDRYEAAICADEAGVIAFFGYDRLSKELFDIAEIDASQCVH
ncbi:MAG: hypothetical protein NTW01_01025 [Gammaproteobacteria bacterium]|nr:hypothetical protein [Gammaproteobacteria bacterium]